jgi:hypothetical protein
MSTHAGIVAWIAREAPIWTPLMLLYSSVSAALALNLPR